jgi:hypothetical protein
MQLSRAESCDVKRACRAKGSSQINLCLLQTKNQPSPTSEYTIIVGLRRQELLHPHV